ncbi:prenyltransferase/squalene oxidase repeat-containing protein [Streptomyces orinoci]|uniref:Prenyltransferase/squalene oxidase repeat-containing protein n=1 Tax=Streptomyces orinoci TaxID=67339 RepID=A0ABV3JS04_STRON|nr:prenyltransferase/squalene oxidase repeat-containing protein [Streptomyces orinoci]
MSLPAHPRAAITLPTALLGSALLLTGGVGMAFADGTPAKGSKPGTAQSARAGGAAGAAAAWAASRLNADPGTLRDHDLTADLVMGLAAAGTQPDTARRATGDLARHAEDYLSQGTKGRISVANTAKLALVAAAMKQDESKNAAGKQDESKNAAGKQGPTNFGTGHDLIATLKDRLQKDGRFTDLVPQDHGLAQQDHSDRISQALAVLALKRATGTVPAEALDRLAAGACTDGGFPLALTGTSATSCTSDPEATAMAVQALTAAGGKDEQAKDAVKWLTGHQHRDGGFATAKGEVNARSTALGVQALNAGGRTAQAAKGLAWLRSVQVSCTGSAAERGAVGWNKPVIDGRTLSATAQVLPALAGKSLGQAETSGIRPALAATGCGEDAPTDDATFESRPSTPGMDATRPSTPGTDPTATSTATATESPAPTGTATATAEPSATATDGTTGSTDGSNGSNGNNDGLAATGMSAAYPAAIAAGALLLTGTAAVTLSRRRGRR